MKTLWIVSGGTEAVPGIEKAKAMGLHVVVSDLNPGAPGFAAADDAVIASTYDERATASAAVRYHRIRRPIDGVICMAADVPATVAAVAEALGLPGNRMAVARRSMDKLAMKECFSRQGVPVPWFRAVENPADLRRIMKEQRRALVVKPVDSRGARGVSRVLPDSDPEAAFAEALSVSQSRRVMVERFIPGPQISTETLVVRGRCHTVGFVDRNYALLERFAPHIIEDGGEQPTALGDAERAAVTAVAERAALAMGIENGVAKGDMVLSDEGPMVIEIAARLSGGWLSSDQIPLGTGVDFIGAAIRLALGETVRPEDLRPTKQIGVAIRYLFPEPGLVRAIPTLEPIRALPFVHRVGLFVSPGDRIGSPTNHTERAGFVIAKGETREAAVAHAETVISALRIETEEVTAV